MNELTIHRARCISDGAMMAFLAQLRDRGAQLEGLNLWKCEMLTGTTLRHIAMLFPRIKRVYMSYTAVAGDSLIDIITQCPAVAHVNLHSIRYKRTAEGCELVLEGSTFPAKFAMLLAACPAPIRKLSADFATPFPSSMRLIEERAASDLHHLALSFTEDDERQIDFPALTRMLSKCVQLRSLHFYNAHYMSDHDLATLVVPSKHMNELGIYRALRISDGAMMAFLAHLHNTGAQLEGLCFYGCEMLTGATLRHMAMLFPRIKRVDMGRTGVTEAMVGKMRQEEGLLKEASVQCGP
jgi:hypothetical protein